MRDLLIAAVLALVIILILKLLGVI